MWGSPVLFLLEKIIYFSKLKRSVNLHIDLTFYFVVIETFTGRHGTMAHHKLFLRAGEDKTFKKNYFLFLPLK